MKSSNGKISQRTAHNHKMELRLAIELGDRIVCHSYDLPQSPSWIHFEKFLRTKLSLTEFTVKYRDEDRDEVTLSSEEEFSEVLKVYEKMSSVLLLKVIPVETDFPKDANEQILIDADGFPGPVNGNKTSEAKITNVTAPVGENKQQSNDDSALVVDVLPLNIVGDQSAAKDQVTTVATSLGCRPKESSGPPMWFTDYMEKFKGDVTMDITKKVVHRMQKMMIRTGSPNVKNEEVKTTEEPKLVQSATSVNIVHTGVFCDNCEQSIIGIRYKCGNCIKYDLCEGCEGIKGIHEPHHVFVKMRYPSKVAGLRKKSGKQVPLLKHVLYDFDDIVLPDSTNFETERNKRSSLLSSDPVIAAIQGHETYGWREKKLLKRLEKQAHKLEKYREKHKQRILDRSSWDAILGAGNHHWRHNHQSGHRGSRIHLVSREEVGRNSDDSVVADRPTSGYNPFTIDLVGAKFLRDETIPDGTIVAPCSVFTKRWRILNSGNKPWPSDTVLECIESNGLLPCRSEVFVPTLLPSEEGIVSVDLVAPLNPGSYVSRWRFSHQNQPFGHKIWCSVVVESVTDSRNMADADRDEDNVLPDVQAEKPKDKIQQEPESGEKEQVPDILKAGLEDQASLKTAKWSDFKPVENVANGSEFSGLMVPRYASITATPNNTPLDLTPPKSPELLDVNESLFDEIGEPNVERNDDDKDVSFLSEDSEFGGSVISLSSVDSDLGYVMVPLPPCFNFTVPETLNVNYDGNKAARDVPIDLTVTPGKEEGNSSVTTATDTDDENANKFEDACAGVSDNVPLQSPVQTEVFPSSAEEFLVTYSPAIPLPPPPPRQSPPPPPPPPPPPLPAEETPEVQNTPDVCPERIIPILPEPIMSAAATVFNSARGIITSIADKQKMVSQSVQIERPVEICPAALARLREMGFYDHERNEQLLRKHKDVTLVINDLLKENDNDWHAHRH